MMGIGPFEILVVLAVLLIVVGPERMPEVIRFCARVLREVRNAASEVREQVEDIAAMPEVRNEIEAVEQAVKTADVREDLRLVADEVDAPPEPPDVQTPVHPE